MEHSYAELRHAHLWTVTLYAPDGVRILEVTRFRMPEDAEHYAERHPVSRVIPPRDVRWLVDGFGSFAVPGITGE